MRPRCSKYKAIVERAGSTFVPLGFNSSGGHTKKVANFIVGIQTAGEENCVPSVMEAADIRDVLAVVIQRGNAMMNMAGAARMRADSPQRISSRAPPSAVSAPHA